jgi:hypothetical protein
MFRVIGAVVVYGFALYGFGHYLVRTRAGRI